MKLYDSVVIIHDHSPDLSSEVGAIRAALEAFGLRVHLYNLAQKQNALDVLAGAIPDCEYVILCCHGERGTDGEPQISIRTIDQAEGDYSKSGGWEIVTVGLTPTSIPVYLSGGGRTLICIACGSGQDSFAHAFVKAGYKAYIAPRGGGVHINAAVLFIVGFFYHLMAANRLDDEPLQHTDQEAAVLASQADVNYTHGTLAFHYYSGLER